MTSTVEREQSPRLLRSFSTVALVTLCVGCAPRAEPLRVTTVAEEVARPPIVAILPAPAPIRRIIPTDWRVIETPAGVFYALTEEQHDQLILWLEDAARYSEEARAQLQYYRDGLREAQN